MAIPLPIQCVRRHYGGIVPEMTVFDVNLRRPRSTSSSALPILVSLLLLLAGCSGPSTPSAPAEDEPRLDVRIGTAATSMVIGETRSFAAEITGAEPTTLTWTPSCGVVDGAGATVAYTAPMSPGTCSLTVSTTVDPDEQHTVFVTVTSAGEGLEVNTVPGEANLDAGGTITITADVRGVEESDLTWSATCGDVDGQGTTALYAAPDAPGSCIVTAASVLDPSRSSSSTFTIEAAEASVSIRTVPERASVYVDTPLFIDAFVSGSSNDDVTWTATCGQVFGMGPAATFEAPSTPGACTVTARSDADPTQSATTVVTVEALPVEESVVLNPSAASVQAGSSTSLAAVVTVDGDPSVTWDATCGTIDESGPPSTPMFMAPPTMHSVLFEAPMEVGECTVTVTSNEDPTISASSIVTVTPVPIEVSVGVAPKNATIRFGETIELQANVTVTGAEDTSVVWTSSCGALTQTETGATLTAPQTAGTCIATATSQLDPTQSASATIQVLEPIQVTVTPSVVVLAPGGERTFEAMVTGTSDDGVDWTASCGTVTGSGASMTYVAPAEAGSCLVTATSTADPTKRFQSSVVVEEPTRVSIDPNEATLKVGATQTLTATVTGSSGGSVTWNATCGTVNGTGATVTYVAPSQPGTCSVTATSTADSSQHAQSIVTVEPEVAIQIAPTSVELEAEAQHAFSATVTGATNPGVTWSATCGTVAGTGSSISYTAPDAAGTCDLTATSVEDASKSATAAIRVTAPVAPGETSFESIASGYSFAVAVDQDGRVWTWGWNSKGQLGVGTTEYHRTPVRVTFPEAVRIEQVAAGHSHVIALDERGRAWAWGDNARGAVGDGTKVTRYEPVAVNMPMGVHFTSVAAPSTNNVGRSFALDATGQAWAWGYNGSGMLGDGTTTDRTVPVKVAQAEGVAFKQLAPAYSHTQALDMEGNVWGWGYNGSSATHSMIGDGTSTRHHTPVQTRMPSDVRVESLSAGRYHMLAIDQEGRVWTWGRGREGRLGDGTGENRGLPTQVVMPSGVRFDRVAAGFQHSIALDDQGRAWGWGWNYYGSTGNGGSTDQYVPVAAIMPSGVSFGALPPSLGYAASFALDAQGQAWGWGYNAGQHVPNTSNVVRQPTPLVMP